MTGTRVSGIGADATGAAGIGLRLGPPAKGVTGARGAVPGLAGAALMGWPFAFIA